MSKGRQDRFGRDSGEDSEVNPYRSADGREVSGASKNDRKKEHTKLAAIVALIGAAAVYSLGPCQKEEDNTHSEDTSAAPDSNDKKEPGDTVFQYPALNSVVEMGKRMPKASVDEHADEFGVPVGLKMPPEEFMR